MQSNRIFIYYLWLNLHFLCALHLINAVLFCIVSLFCRIDGFRLSPDTPHVVGEMGECEDKGNGEQGLVFFPSYRLLMPKSGDYAEYGKGQSQYDEDHIAFTVCLDGIQLAMLVPVVRVNVESDKHPQYESYPGVGRKETHHAQAGKYS